jgi:DNA-binding PadR family transcriptional regulator
MNVDLVGAIAAAVGGLGVGWAAHYLWARGRVPAEPPSPPPPPSPAPVARPFAPSPAPPPTVVVASKVPAAGPPALAPQALSAAGPPPAKTPAATEGLGLARRVILHLSLQGPLAYDEVARVGFTQQGMASSLVVRQGSLVRVLQRLEAADVLTVERRHVSGSDRRLKVYRLTSLGESVARDLRHPKSGTTRVPPPPRAPEPPPSATAGEWVVGRTPSGIRRP